MNINEPIEILDHLHFNHLNYEESYDSEFVSFEISSEEEEI